MYVRVVNFLIASPYLYCFLDQPKSASLISQAGVWIMPAESCGHLSFLNYCKFSTLVNKPREICAFLANMVVNDKWWPGYTFLSEGFHEAEYVLLPHLSFFFALSNLFPFIALHRKPSINCLPPLLPSCFTQLKKQLGP